MERAKLQIATRPFSRFNSTARSGGISALRASMSASCSCSSSDSISLSMNTVFFPCRKTCAASWKNVNHKWTIEDMIALLPEKMPGKRGPFKREFQTAPLPPGPER